MKFFCYAFIGIAIIQTIVLPINGDQTQAQTQTQALTRPLPQPPNQAAPQGQQAYGLSPEQIAYNAHFLNQNQQLGQHLPSQASNPNAQNAGLFGTFLPPLTGDGIGNTFTNGLGGLMNLAGLGQAPPGAGPFQTMGHYGDMATGGLTNAAKSAGSQLGGFGQMLTGGMGASSPTRTAGNGQNGQPMQNAGPFETLANMMTGGVGGMASMMGQAPAQAPRQRRKSTRKLSSGPNGLAPTAPQGQNGQPMQNAGPFESLANMMAGGVGGMPNMANMPRQVPVQNAHAPQNNGRQSTMMPPPGPNGLPPQNQNGQPMQNAGPFESLANMMAGGVGGMASMAGQAQAQVSQKRRRATRNLSSGPNGLPPSQDGRQMQNAGPFEGFANMMAGGFGSMPSMAGQAPVQDGHALQALPFVPGIPNPNGHPRSHKSGRQNSSGNTARHTVTTQGSLTGNTLRGIARGFNSTADLLDTHTTTYEYPQFNPQISQPDMHNANSHIDTHALLQQAIQQANPHADPHAIQQAIKQAFPQANQVATQHLNQPAGQPINPQYPVSQFPLLNPYGNQK